MFHRSTSRLRIDTTLFAPKPRRLFAAHGAQQYRDWVPAHVADSHSIDGWRVLARTGARLRETVAAHPRPFLHIAMLFLAAVTAAASIGE
jgi:hypothetical protein